MPWVATSGENSEWVDDEPVVPPPVTDDSGDSGGGGNNNPGFMVGAPTVDPGAFTDPNAAHNNAIINKRMHNAADAPMTQIQGPGAFRTGSGMGASNQFRNSQLSLVEQLQQRAAGQGPTVAGAQMDAGMEQSIAAANAAAVSNRGGNPALAQRIVQQQAAQQQQATAQQAGIAAMQEQQGAQQLLSGTLDTARGADVTTRGQTLDARVAARGQDTQTAIAQGQLSVEQETQRNNLVQQYTQMGIDVDQAQFLAQQEMERMRIEAEMAAAGVNAQTYQTEYGADAAVDAARYGANAQREGSMWGAIGAGVGAAVGMGSDENMKKNIDYDAADPALHAMLDALEPAEYEYKDPDKPLRGHGKHLSVMAQQLLKSEAGSRLVTDTPEGLVVDYGKGFGVRLASEAHLHKRLKELEASTRRSA